MSSRVQYRQESSIVVVVQPKSSSSTPLPCPPTIRELQIAAELAIWLNVQPSRDTTLQKIRRAAFSNSASGEKCAKYLATLLKLENESERYRKHVHLYISWWRAAYHTTGLDVIASIFADMQRFVAMPIGAVPRTSVPRQLSRTVSDVASPLYGRDRSSKSLTRWGRPTTISGPTPRSAEKPPPLFQPSSFYTFSGTQRAAPGSAPPSRATITALDIPGQRYGRDAEQINAERKESEDVQSTSMCRHERRGSLDSDSSYALQATRSAKLYVVPPSPREEPTFSISSPVMEDPHSELTLNQRQLRRLPSPRGTTSSAQSSNTRSLYRQCSAPVNVCSLRERPQACEYAAFVDGGADLPYPTPASPYAEAITTTFPKSNRDKWSIGKLMRSSAMRVKKLSTSL